MFIAFHAMFLIEVALFYRCKITSFLRILQEGTLWKVSNPKDTNADYQWFTESAFMNNYIFMP